MTYTDNGGLRLVLRALRPGRRYLVRRYRVDDAHDLTLVGRSILRGRDVRLSATLPAPAVELIKIDPRRRWASHRGSRLRRRHAGSLCESLR